MRLIEQRRTVIGPGATVRLKKEAARSIKDLMARWRVLGLDEEVLRVEDVEDIEDVRTLKLEDVERVSGGPEEVVSLIAGDDNYYLSCPEHDEWPACLREDANDEVSGPEEERGSLFDDPEALLDEEDDDDDDEDVA